MNDYKKQQLATAVKWGVGLLAAASIALVVFMAVQGLTGDGGGLSCEDRGGRLVLSHMIPIFSGKTMIMVPVYRCEEVAGTAQQQPHFDQRMCHEAPRNMHLEQRANEDA